MSLSIYNNKNKYSQTILVWLMALRANMLTCLYYILILSSFFFFFSFAFYSLFTIMEVGLGLDPSSLSLLITKN